MTSPWIDMIKTKCPKTGEHHRTDYGPGRVDKLMMSKFYCLDCGETFDTYD